MAPESDDAGTDDPLLIGPPESGRIHAHRRLVRLADGSPKGRLRLDAVARMLQDVSDEDTTDAGFPADEPWVVRRVLVGVTEFPTFRDTVTVSTWCSGIGGRWAQRRVTIVGDGGGQVDAAVLWVHLDARGRPARLPERFEELYGSAARGRRVRARLEHDPLPAGSSAAAAAMPAASPFPLRFRDFDLMGHVNNAVSWEPVEDALASRPHLSAPLRVSVEHPRAIEIGAEPEVVVVDRPAVGGRSDGLDLWIVVDGQVCSSAQVRTLPG